MPRVASFSVLLGVLAMGGIACQRGSAGVERISPSIGLMAGGEKVTIFGRGFQDNGLSAVYLGSHRAPRFGGISDTEAWFNTPLTSQKGAVDVRVVMQDGTEYLIPSGFEFMRRNRMAECVNISKKLNGTFDDSPMSP